MYYAVCADTEGGVIPGLHFDKASFIKTFMTYLCLKCVILHVLNMIITAEEDNLWPVQLIVSVRRSYNLQLFVMISNKSWYLIFSY